MFPIKWQYPVTWPNRLFLEEGYHIHIPEVKVSPLCRCGDSVETTKHYFLECALYAIERITLHNALSTTGSFNLQTILYGGGSCNTKDDKNIIEAVYKYVNDTGRFN